MSFKEDLKAEIKLDRLLQELVATIREPPGKRWRRYLPRNFSTSRKIAVGSRTGNAVQVTQMTGETKGL